MKHRAPGPFRFSPRERETGLILFDNPIFDEHDPGYGHPESPRRLSAIRAELAPRGWPVRPGRSATREEILLVHSSEHVDHMLSQQGRSAWLDPDTAISPRSVEAALWAAGSAVEAADVALGGVNCFVLGRPPGHHAMPTHAMGFCLFNTAAIAAAYLAAKGLRVLVFDPDVHHGNGTQEAFYRRSDVFYVSFHRAPYFPGTGAASEVGEGEGYGYTMNIPLPVGTDDGHYLSAMEQLVLPAVEHFCPHVCVLSAGFDAMEGDLLGGMALSTPALAILVEAVTTRFPTVAVLEGGYNLKRLGRDVLEVAEVLAGAPASVIQAPVVPSWLMRLREWEHPMVTRPPTPL